jgi:hypothetical protein
MIPLSHTDALTIGHPKWVASIFDKLVRSPKTVMPDLIRYPEIIEFTGFRLPPE